MFKRFILRTIYRVLKKKPTDFEMVGYWMNKEYVQGKLTKAEDGSTVMFLEGEKYPIPSFPRSHLLFGPLSKLKHEIKNQVFNESWALLEEGKSNEEVARHIKDKLLGSVAEVAQILKYDMMPAESMSPPVKEIHRAWTKVAPERTYVLRDYLCLILQEDDGYRNRVQWLVEYFNPNIWYMRFVSPVKLFKYALEMLEHGEVVGDMKDKIKLLRRVLLVALEDKRIRELFNAFVREVNWKKVALTAGDKYHFRAKYFKVDYPYLEY